MYFNIFSASLSKNNTPTSPSHNCQYSRIAEYDNRGSGCQGHGRGRGHVQYNLYSLARKYVYLITEARVYPKEQWMALSCDQRESVTRKKTVARWLDGGAPSSGFTLNYQGRDMVSNSPVSNIKAKTSNSNCTYTSGLVSLLPLSGPTTPILPIVITEANSSGQYFFKDRYTSTATQWFKFNWLHKHQWEAITSTNIWRQWSANQFTHQPDIASDNDLDCLDHPHDFDIFQHFLPIQEAFNFTQWYQSSQPQTHQVNKCTSVNPPCHKTK